MDPSARTVISLFPLFVTLFLFCSSDLMFFWFSVKVCLPPSDEASTKEWKCAKRWAGGPSAIREHSSVSAYLHSLLPPLSRSPTHSVPLHSVWMQSPVGFLVFCFYLCRACYGVSMETGSGSCAGTGHERRRRRIWKGGRGRMRERTRGVEASKMGEGDWLIDIDTGPQLGWIIQEITLAALKSPWRHKLCLLFNIRYPHLQSC